MLYLVRHGQTAWNAERRCQGHIDIELDDDGIEQAERLGSAFADRPIKRIFASDLKRAVQTAAPLARTHGVSVETLPALRERSFGEWEGSSFDEIARFFIEHELAGKGDRTEVRPPGGESLHDVWDRLASVVSMLSSVHDPSVVVTHGGTASLLLSRLIGGDLRTSLAFKFGNCSVTTLSRRPDTGCFLSGYNDMTHLKERALAGSIDGVSR